MTNYYVAMDECYDCSWYGDGNEWRSHEQVTDHQTMDYVQVQDRYEYDSEQQPTWDDLNDDTPMFADDFGYEFGDYQDDW